MEPQIQYAKTVDGVSIAYWTLGEGEPLVYMPQPLISSAHGEWQLPTARRWYESLSANRTLIRLDHRGSGLSQRDATEYSVEALGRDLEAVLDAESLETVSLWAEHDAGFVAMSFAARYPERLNRLILWHAYARGTDIPEHPALQALEKVVDRNWQLFTDTIVQTVLGWSGPEGHEYARLIREATTARTFSEAFGPVAWEFDVSTLLSSIRCPTLVLHRRDHQYFPVRLSANLAAEIPKAHLTIVEGSTSYPWLEVPEQLLQTIATFLGDGRAAAEEEVAAGATGMAVILFADIADSTALTERLGDAAFRDKARVLDEALRRAITSNGGQAIDGKLLGDGVLATFGAAREAIAGASAIHDAGRYVALPLHVGIHAGDVLREQNNVYGGAVNIASRICSEAAAGETLVSSTVRDLARTSAGVSFEDRGERELKGVSEPLRVWAVLSAS